MNEKQLNKNPGISKSITIHTASLDSLFIIHIFIASSLPRISAYVYFLFAIQILILHIYIYTQIYAYTYVHSFFHSVYNPSLMYFSSFRADFSRL